MNNSIITSAIGIDNGHGYTVNIDEVQRIVQQNAHTLHLKQLEIEQLSAEVKRLEQYETFYLLYKGLKQ